MIQHSAYWFLEVVLCLLIIGFAAFAFTYQKLMRRSQLRCEDCCGILLYRAHHTRFPDLLEAYCPYCGTIYEFQIMDKRRE